MPNLKILVWEHREPQGEPDVEVKIPTSMAKWIPKMMRFVPKKNREEMWGGEVDFDAMFSDIDQMIKTAAASGSQELMSVRAKDTHVKVLIQG
ncbi:MAG: hypothetical protein LYZ69_05760 [Nitrososphaerales archaeon]|nr:hypothetical protein [Nitrososphaerales archaeon]